MGLRLLTSSAADVQTRAWIASCGRPAMHLGRPRDPPAADKPWWVDALEESLLLAIGLFALITWVVLIAVISH